MKRLLMLAAIALIACPSVVQTQEPKLKTSVTKSGGNERRALLLKINYNPAGPPGECSVQRPDVKPHWIWVTRFVRIPGHQPKTGEWPIWGVKIEAQYNGETADVRLTLLRRYRQSQREDLVKAYQVGVNEETILNELTEFGIEPF